MAVDVNGKLLELNKNKSFDYQFSDNLGLGSVIIQKVVTPLEWWFSLILRRSRKMTRTMMSRTAWILPVVVW